MYSAARSSTALGLVTSGTEITPSGVQWPTNANYAQGMVQAVGQVSDATTISFDEGGDFSPPVMVQVVGLKATLESTTGMSLAQLQSLAGDITTLSHATSPTQIVSAISNLIHDSLAVFTSVADAAHAADTTIAAIGGLSDAFQFTGKWMTFVAGMFETMAKQEQGCDQYAHDLARQRCVALTQADRPVATSADGVTPADLFRILLYWRQRKRSQDALPLNMSSLYFALCGGEVRTGRQLFSREDWNRFVLGFQNQTGKKHISIPVGVQRRMWALVDGILNQVVEPGIRENILMVGDGGNSLYPILQDLTRNLYLAGKQKRGYGIDDEFLLALEHVILAHTAYADVTCDCNVPIKTAGAQCSVSEDTDVPGKPNRYFAFFDCARLVQPGSVIVEPFLRSLSDFQDNILARFQNANGTWSLVPSGAKINPSVIRGALTLGVPAMTDLLRGVSNAQRAAALTNSEAQRVAVSNQSKALAATLAVVLGGGGFMLARRYAKRHRS